MSKPEWEEEFDDMTYTIIGRIIGDENTLSLTTTDGLPHCQVVLHNETEWNVVDRTSIPEKHNVIPEMDLHNAGEIEVEGEPEINHEYFE
jgi:hypothetical protein